MGHLAMLSLLTGFARIIRQVWFFSFSRCCSRLVSLLVYVRYEEKLVLVKYVMVRQYFNILSRCTYYKKKLETPVPESIAANKWKSGETYLSSIKIKQRQKGLITAPQYIYIFLFLVY